MARAKLKMKQQSSHDAGKERGGESAKLDLAKGKARLEYFG